MKLITLANNQTVVEINDLVSFFSYDVEIAMYDKITKTLILDTKWDFSNTTRKYFKTFINNYTCFTYDSKKQWTDTIHGTMDINVKIKL